MFKASVLPDKDVLDAIAKDLPKAPILMRSVMALKVRRLDDEVISKLRVEPPKPTYPLRWKSAKQRAAYFATNGFGKGIPYRRTGDMLKRWVTLFIPTPDGGDIEVRNDSPHVDYVQGFDQQPFHIDTGWVFAPPIIAEADIVATEFMIDAWYEVGEQIALGGTR